MNPPTAAVDRFAAEAGGLDLAIANAGVAHYGRFEDQDPELHERMTRINWLGTLNTARAALPHLRAGGGGPARDRLLRPGPAHVPRGRRLRRHEGRPARLRRGAAPRARGHAASSVTTVYPGEIVSELHAHEKATMPAWYHGDGRAAPGGELAAAVLEGIEADRRSVAFPREVRLLALDAVAPASVDRLLRRLRGPTAAPRRYGNVNAAG